MSRIVHDFYVTIPGYGRREINQKEADLTLLEVSEPTGLSSGHFTLKLTADQLAALMENDGVVQFDTTALNLFYMQARKEADRVTEAYREDRG